MANKNTNPQYFEGIFQLRNPSQSAVDFIEKAIDKKENVHVAKIVELKSGLDFYLNSNQFLMKLGRMLLKEFGGILKVSSTLHTRNNQTSKELYRVTVMLELPDYVKGDVIVKDDKIVLVTSLDKRMHGINLKNNKRIITDFDKNIEILEKHDVIVTKVHPDIEVMHPETYQSIPAKNKPKKKLSHGQKAKITIYNEEAYFV